MQEFVYMPDALSVTQGAVSKHWRTMAGFNSASLEAFGEFNRTKLYVSNWFRWIRQFVTYLHFSSEFVRLGALIPVYQPLCCAFLSCCMLYYAFPPTARAEALSDAFVWCMSVAYIGPKSRTERPRKTKIGTEVDHVTRDSDTTFKVKVTSSLYSALR